MAQITIYLDKQTEARMRAAARAAGLSYSRWIAQLIEQTARNEWPAFVRELAGAWRDHPEALPASGEDVAREPF